MNDTTKWIMIALLLLLIGAAVFMLLRSPGRGNDLDGDGRADRLERDGADRDRDGTPDHLQRSDRGVYDQESEVVTDDGVATDDQGWAAEAARIGAMGAAGSTAAAGAATAAAGHLDDEPVYTDDAAVADETVYTEETVATDEPVYTDDTTVADETVYTESTYDDDSTAAADAARIGALGAAGATAAAADDQQPVSTQESGSTEETVYTDDTTFADGTSEDFAADEEPYRPASYEADGTDSDEPVGTTGYEAAPASDGYQAAPASEGYEAAPASDGYQAAPASEGYEAAPASDGYEAAPASDGDVAEPAPAEDTDFWRQAATIGATGAAGAGAVAATTHDEEPVAETTYEETVYEETADAGDIQPLSSDAVDAGASQEPLSFDEQEPADELRHEGGFGHGQVTDTTDIVSEESVAADEATGTPYPVTDETVIDETVTDEPLTADEVLAADGRGEVEPTEYPVGEETTYRTDGGSAVEVGDGATTYTEGTYEEPGSLAYDGTAETTDVSYEETGTVTAAGEAAYAEGDGSTLGDGGTRADGYVGGDDRAHHLVETEGGAATEATGSGFTEAAYGAGSAEPFEDGSGPQGWAIKGNAGSMLFHTEDSPSYDAVRAEVWFESEEAARAAGFAHWDRHRR